MSLPTRHEQGPPRALRSLARIIEDNLCHRCGSCVGICPTSVLGVDENDFPRVDNLSACTDCDLCVKVCPGDELDFQGINNKLFNKPGDLKFTHGHFSEALIAYATDEEVRGMSTSGGLVSAIIIELLKQGAIDGAIVTVSDEERIWKGKPIIARTREQVLAACKSKYAISPTNVMLSEIKKEEGRFAVIGLPCQIHGIQKAVELDARLKDKIALTIGLFCHAAIEHEAFEVIWDSLGEKTKGSKKFVSRLGKHPGAPHLELADGTMYPVYFGNKKGYRPSSMEMLNVIYRLYTPARCFTCFDALAEFADIAIGDPWIAPPDESVDFYKGWSFGLLRTGRGKEMYDKVLNSGAIKAREIVYEEALRCNHMMAPEKKWRAFRVIETHRRQGKSIPSYGAYPFAVPKHGGIQFVKTEANLLTHIMCFMPKWRKPVLKFFLGNGGYYLLWANNLRRRFRLWVRDLLAKWRYKRRDKL